MPVVIRQVANGWLVYPYDMSRESSFMADKDVRVFNTFEDLAAHLKAISGAK